jgi:hypothetical protein
MDALQVDATAEGIAALRLVRGLILANDRSELAMLGAMRRQRKLIEAVAGTNLLGKAVDIVHMRHNLQCAVVSVRSRLTSVGYPDKFDGYLIQEGDVLLVEGFPSCIGTDAWMNNFGISRVIANSTPQRSGTRSDFLRAVGITIGLFLTIGGAAIGGQLKIKNLSLNVLATLLLCFIFVIKGSTPREAYSTLNPGVLLSIIGALALGDSVESSGLANFLADAVTSACAPGGKYAVLAGLYVAAATLGLVITNPAVVAILGSIGAACANDVPGLKVSEVALVLVWASSNCYMSPYAYACNLMVMPVGKYTWGDFIRFGAPCQLLHMIVSVAIAPMCASFNEIYLK